jgi:hypothetical protein
MVLARRKHQPATSRSAASSPSSLRRNLLEVQDAEKRQKEKGRSAVAKSGIASVAHQIAIQRPSAAVAHPAALRP